MIQAIAQEFKNSKNFLYLGRGANFPVALEGALKLKEISYIHAEGYPAAEMKHGPIALIDKNMPVVFIVPKDAIYEKVISNIQEVRARKGRIIAVANEDDEEIDADGGVRHPRAPHVRVLRSDPEYHPAAAAGRTTWRWRAGRMWTSRATWQRVSPSNRTNERTLHETGLSLQAH